MTMRPFTAAAVQFAPAPGPLTAASVKANLAKAAGLVERCVRASGAELVVLPESCTTGFTPGVPAGVLWELMSSIPGPVTEPLQEAARDLGVHVCLGTYERGEPGPGDLGGPGPGDVYPPGTEPDARPDAGPRADVPQPAVHNAAVLIGPSGDVLGVYRKTHPFGPEDARRGGWVTPGETVSVVDTPLGRIGMAICFDGDFPELWRIMAAQGAEVICRPSALLRSADIWELTTRARAYDNHVYVVGANAIGTDPAGTFYFGNSMIVSPTATVLARATSHESWVSARLDPATAMPALSPGSSVPQPFDHLAERNLRLYERHAADLLGPAATTFPYGSGGDAGDREAGDGRDAETG
jgi:deaminated glutathione amidase